jgi:hypothetical protein
VHAEQVKLISRGKAPKPREAKKTEKSEQKTDIFKAFDEIEEE